MQAQNLTFIEAEKYADQLVSKNILTAQGKAALLKEKKQDHIDPLGFLASAFRSAQIFRLVNNSEIERNITPEDSLLRTSWGMSGDSSNFDRYTDYISPKRSTLGLTRTRTLNDLMEIGLINDMVYEQCKKGLQGHTIEDEPSLLEFANQMTLYYSKYDLLKERQVSYISELADFGLITKVNKDAILNSLKPYEIKEESEILSFSDRYRLVDLRDVAANPDIIYPIIFNKIRELLPDFHYSDLKVETVEKPVGSLIEQQLVLSFTVRDSKYKHSFFYNFRKPIPDSSDSDEPKRVSQDFHKGVNKWLTDIKSPYRLYMVNLPEKGEGVYGNKKMGLLLLKKGESELISKNPYLLSRESFDNRFGQANIRKMVKEFSDKGFFSHLSNREVDSAKQTIPSADINSIESLLLSFPKTIVYFDWETGNLENPYEDLTLRFAEASRGIFQPSNLLDGFKKGWPPPDTKTIKYGFTFKGKRYESNLKFNGDWLDPEFFEMIKLALRDGRVDGDFYYCISDGQASGFIFLTKEQLNFVKEKYPDLLKEE